MPAAAMAATMSTTDVSKFLLQAVDHPDAHVVESCSTEIAGIAFPETFADPRDPGGGGTQGFFTADWEPLPDCVPVGFTSTADIAPPRDLDVMLEMASRLGAAVGDYCRVDIFDTDRGPVFNEFSLTPHNGKVTAFADEYLGDHWQRMIDRGQDVQGGGTVEPGSSPG